MYWEVAVLVVGDSRLRGNDGGGRGNESGRRGNESGKRGDDSISNRTARCIKE